MPAGDHAFLFDIPLPSKILGTITGPNHQYHTYRVDAIVERRLKPDLVVSQPIRIYQVSDLETSYLRPHCPLVSPMLEGHSSQDIQYCISIADRNVPFGCTFPIECWFAPLVKGAKLSTVTVEVIEKQTAQLEATAAESVRHNVRFITAAQTQIVFCKTIDFSGEQEVSGDEFSEIEWRFATSVCLPRSMDACSQSIATKHVKIAHELRVTAEFRDESGNVVAKVRVWFPGYLELVSDGNQVAEVLPFKIHMTPNVGGEDQSVQQVIQRVHETRCPPPAYSDHFSDLIVPVANQLHLFEDPLLAEIHSARSSGEGSSMDGVDPSPRYEETV
ncbi:uncharacterized protein N7515_008682 [Penicillium bovifimosum]|uniref:Arrestin C-terminal-like domain-containing protein n=1 Tax=Penicillium bovifimosum TaxID=126998 RepID=A0A9W9KXQ3_9EURO|nr:uncharacterized protein N7515_008682 [Penicillium bovifimosum]KAJ5124857.1 hypothetical protein N7515_008682 [Penicillium bovifimosum]